MAFVLRAFLAALAALSQPTAHDGFQAAQRNGVVVFSRQVDGRFRIIARRRGARDTVMPVAPSEAPFDVELAPVPGRGLVVACARCRATGTLGEGLKRRACRLGQVRVDGRGGERRLGPRPRSGLSYRYPALQGRRLAYLRVPDSGGRAAAVVDGRVVLARDRVDGPDGVYGLDLARYGVAAVFEQMIADDVAVRTLLLKRPGCPTLTAAIGATGIENDGYVVTPAFSGRYLYWGYANHGWTVRTRRSYVFRRDLASGARTGALLSPYVTSVAVDAGRPGAPVVVTTDNGLDSPQRLVSRQTVRTLREPTYRTVPHDDLIYP